jgi:hypothetical protein
MTGRQKAAALARDLYANKIDFKTFAMTITGEDDEDISELVDLITHEPKSGGFLGVKKSIHDQYMKKIWSLIEKLEKEGKKASNKPASGDSQ